MSREEKRRIDKIRAESAFAEQQDILARVKVNAFNRRSLDVLARCDATTCGSPANCREVCAFGQLRRIRSQSQSIAQLLANDTDLFEVRVSRANWSCGLNDLDPVTIGAVINLNRRALDKIQESVVAVGTIKVFASPARDEEAEDVWRWEIHEIISCSSRDLIDQAFSSGHLDPGLDSSMRITEVRNLTEVINTVLAHDLVEWKHPSDPADPLKSSKKWRREYYGWALQLNVNDRLIRYGCDRYLNRLKKPSRVGPQAKKPRPYPVQLTRHMYGSHPYHCRCRICLGQRNNG